MALEGKRLLYREVKLKRHGATGIKAPKDHSQSSIALRFAYIKEERAILLLALFSCVGFFLLIALLAVTFSTLPPYLPLFYSLPWGEGQLIALPLFTLLPFIILAIFCLNALVGAQLYKNYKTLVKLLFFASSLATLLLVITATKIVLLVKG